MSLSRASAGGGSVEAFLRSVSDGRRRQDCYFLVKLMQNVVGESGRVCGDSVLGFGSRRGQAAGGSGQADFRLGFAPRKNEITLYLGGSLEGLETIVARLGKCRPGKGCLHLKDLDGINPTVLQQLLVEANARARAG
ncbi:MAG: DUF1801 domain-containing protein [Nevskiaceae bacterium]|nr:MAG: DUF1801 domain-containing protein [Nevskiaceae bacterium]TAM30759.1 MAG: DUF1801 domain-containing protein [Nevskiaceae bacterium]